MPKATTADPGPKSSELFLLQAAPNGAAEGPLEVVISSNREGNAAT